MSFREPEPPPTDALDRKPPGAYTGPDKYIEWIRDYLNIELTEAQQTVARSVATNEKTQVIGANGFGKSFIAACLTLAFLFRNYPASVMATSGTYGKLKRTYCKDVESVHQKAWGLPGTYKQSPPRIEVDDDPDIFFQAAAPRDPGELEGVHNKYVLSIIEEADKAGVTREVLSSMESLMTDDRDRMLVVSNPPEDEADMTAELMEDETWNTLQFSSFDSHNVRIETGEIEGDYIPELVTLDRIKSDWESWNGRPWPGLEDARESYELDDLDQRWYRRRLGVMPPETAGKNRPFKVADVKQAFGREPHFVSATPDGIGLDVARGTGDYNALCAVFGDELRVLDYWHGTDHNANEENVRDEIQPAWTCDFAVDAIGEGSGLADRIDTWYPSRVRFYAGANPGRVREYDDCWSEGMYLLGKFLQEGGSFNHTRLREEMLAAARSVDYDEKFVNKYGTNVLELASKGNVKDRLERSPDLLDAAMMACWAADDKTGTSGGDTVPATW